MIVFILEFLGAFSLVAFINLAQNHLSVNRRDLPFWLKILIELAILLPIIFILATYAPEVFHITYLSAVILGAIVGGFAPDIIKAVLKK